MVPPMNVATKAFNAGAPIREWNIYGSYDRANECRADRDQQSDFWLENKFEQTQEVTRTATLQALQHSECIATDDPRLKEK